MDKTDAWREAAENARACVASADRMKVGYPSIWKEYLRILAVLPAPVPSVEERLWAENARLREVLDGLSVAYLALADGCGNTAHVSLASWYSHARAALASPVEEQPE